MLELNDEIIRAVPRAARMRQRLHVIRRRENQIRKELEMLRECAIDLERDLQTVEGVTRVVDGIAVSEIKGKTRYGRSYTVVTCDRRTYNRSAEVYANAHAKVHEGHPQDFCIQLRDYKIMTQSGSTHLGNSFRLREATEIALRWAVTGNLPDPVHLEWCRELFKRDPDRRWKRDRVAAEESAWRLGAGYEPRP